MKRQLTLVAALVAALACSPAAMAQSPEQRGDAQARSGGDEERARPLPEADELLSFGVHFRPGLDRDTRAELERIYGRVEALARSRTTGPKLMPEREMVPWEVAASEMSHETLWSGAAGELARDAGAERFVFIEVAPADDGRLLVRGVRGETDESPMMWRRAVHIAAGPEQLKVELRRVSANLLGVELELNPVALREEADAHDGPDADSPDLDEQLSRFESDAYERAKRRARRRVEAFEAAAPGSEPETGEEIDGPRERRERRQAQDKDRHKEGAKPEDGGGSS